ncbi:quinon protein alcohol dehydrogenase-like superfamily [Suillus paluster]|uniref:quinon protein alcohol dehydrogenase-like superfamily n=1 Tax=Suillus paluster TaxID=48578 RepID=UPI001B87F67E|nr:quinon protein alcohol dehydrogenase-like superfamily [Suillus paluster]KAG1748304.1 quinon protein alcohol dehydrogenase-like superfamily [Suillus paluster]
MYCGTGSAPATSQFKDYTGSLLGETINLTRVDHPPRLDAKRRQTLFNLLNALNELSQTESLGRDLDQHPSFEDDRDVPTVDEQLQVAGAEAFNKFQKRINSLDKELRNFANAARQLGSSVGILSSAFRLRERLAQILFLFRDNAADLFPRKVSRQQREFLVNPNLMDRKRKARRRKSMPGRVPANVEDSLDLESLPEQFENFATALMTFLKCLNEFPEFTDEAVNTSIKSFEGDLKYWACCLQDYRGQFKYPAVQRYVHDLTAEMGEHIDIITGTLSMFIEVGVPTIRFAQKHGAANLLTLSTVATFFSAVTATTLQFSYAQTGDILSDGVNAFWFSSLVFSIAAAVNSLLGLSWKQAMYRSPGDRVPWWVLIWIKRSPLVFLVMSVACFSAGLVLFTYSTNQGKVTSTITTVFTAFTSFGLAAVSAWFASERWTFVHHRGSKWLSDVLKDALRHFMALRLVSIVSKAFGWGSRYVQKGVEVAGLKIRRVPSMGTTTIDQGDNLTTGESVHNMTYPLEPPPPLSSIRQSMDSHSQFSAEGSSHPNLELPTTTFSSMSNSPITPRDRLTSAIRSVMMLQSATSSPSNPFSSPARKRTTSGSKVASLIPKLKSLEATQDLTAHSALVRHLQFSPNGKFLATSSWDRTSIIFRIGEPCVAHRVLAHASGFVGQVAWSPAGVLLLTRLNRAIKIWTEDGVCRKTIERHHHVQSIAWFPGGEGEAPIDTHGCDTDNSSSIAFLSVEGSEVVKLDLNGNVLDTYHFNRVFIHDVAITPDLQRLLGVGPILYSPGGLHPSKSRVEKQLLVYNVETKVIENQTPVLNDVRDITLAKNGQVALVSYENKAPPQLWKLEMVKDQARLTLRHTYMPKMPVDFAGPSYFGGKDDQLVLCAGKAGDIHIWDRDSAVLLHHVRAQALGGDLTCIAWNHASDNPFMFATGSHDGAVRLWTTANDYRHLTTVTAHSTPHSITPRSPSPVDNGTRMNSAGIQLGEYTSEPLTLTPVEDSGQRDRFVTFAPSHT